MRGLGVFGKGGRALSLGSALGNRFVENEGCGIEIAHVEEGAWTSFSGEIRGRGNEIFDNAQGDLCPEEYPWPEGFTTP